MRRVLHKAFGIVGIGVALALAALVLPRFLGRKRLRFPYLTGSLPAADYQALASRPGWSAVKVTVAPGIQLQGLVRRAATPQAPWLLYYPGNDAEQLRRGQAFLSDVGAGKDWGLAVFAYRGYDSSDGVPHLDDLAADAPQILLELCRLEQTSPEHVNVVGFSIGGHLAVRAVGALTRSGQAPRSLSLLASVDDIVMYRRSPWEKLSAGDDYQTRPFLADIHAPVLVLQGGADETLGGPVQGKAIADALGARAKYVELPGVGHNVLIQTPSAVKALRSFLAPLVE